MDLLAIYEEYVEINKDYISLIEYLVNTDFKDTDEEEISLKLYKAQKEFERLMRESEVCTVGEENQTNLQDLCYLVVDALFLSTDLNHFYMNRELGRFKMRAINYLNKRNRAEFFGEDLHGTCRV